MFHTTQQILHTDEPHDGIEGARQEQDRLVGATMEATVLASDPDAAIFGV
jgi:hypothetical protein